MNNTQRNLFDVIDAAPAAPSISHGTAGEIPDLDSYDHCLIMSSGGKDSLACLCVLLDMGVARDKIELWHHLVDGAEGSTLMDWPCTEGYCEAIAHAFGLRHYASWKIGGFEREMNRHNSPTAPTRFETPDGVMEVGGNGPCGTRLRFPQVSASLTTRYCSAYLKIDPCSAAIRNQARFIGKRILVITGERAQESAARARYATFEPDRSDNRNARRNPRHVDHWRPVHGFDEAQVWAMLEKYRINPHPAYHLGFGRLSCMSCIFGSKHQWATVRAIAPERFERIARYEEQFGCTIQRKHSVRTLADMGTPYPSLTQEMVEIALSRTYERPIFVDDWRLPAGAYGEACGPT